MVKNKDDEITLFMLYLSFSNWYCFFIVFFIYYLFKRFTFLLVNAENLSEGSVRVIVSVRTAVPDHRMSVNV